MFSLFQIRTADRVILLLVWLLLMRIGLFLSELPYLQPEIHWWLIGEKMLAGGLLYRDIWDDAGPLPSVVYALLSAIWPRSELLSLLVATGLTFFQALLFNRVCTRYNLVDERSLMPAAMWILFSHIGFDWCFLNPMQIGVTFLIPVLGLIFRHIRIGIEEHKIYETGFWIGLAGLCHLPYVVFLLFTAISFLLYTGTRPRWYAVLGIGMLFPFIFTGFIFYFLNGLSGFTSQYLLAPFSIPAIGYARAGFVIASLVPAIVLATWATVRVMTHRGYINFQQVSHVVMLMSVIAGLLSYAISTWHQPATLYPLIMPAAYYTAQWSYLVRRAVLRELLLLGMVAATLVCIYLPFLPLQYLNEQFMKQGLVVFKPEYPAIAGRKVLVMGHDPAFYLSNKPATPYLNRRLAASILDDSLSFESNYILYHSFRADMPEVIYDADSSLSGLFRRMPLLASFYEKDVDLKGVFFLRKGKKPQDQE